MLVFLLKILLAHLLGDFLFQRSKWVQDKEKNKYWSVFLYLHIAIHAAILLVLLQFELFYWVGIAIILVSHFLIDLAKVYLHSYLNKRLLFLVDQLAHLVILGFVLYLYFPFSIPLELFFSTQVLIWCIFLLFITVVTSVIMKVIISRWDFSNFNDINSLEKAGTYIGILERLFIFGFILIDFWPGIGFLLTAKSVFRFGDLSKSNDRQLTEYILIGTLLSFGIAIFSGLLFKYVWGFIHT